jgi:hypothetical protein
MEFRIQPIQVPKIATRVKINVNVILDEKAYVNVAFYEEGSEFTPIETKVITIEGEAYKKWGNDDTYIKKIVYETLGIPEPEPEPEPEAEIILDP